MSLDQIQYINSPEESEVQKTPSEQIEEFKRNLSDEYNTPTRERSTLSSATLYNLAFKTTEEMKEILKGNITKTYLEMHYDKGPVQILNNPRVDGRVARDLCREFKEACENSPEIASLFNVDIVPRDEDSPDKDNQSVYRLKFSANPELMLGEIDMERIKAWKKVLFENSTEDVDLEEAKNYIIEVNDLANLKATSIENIPKQELPNIRAAIIEHYLLDPLNEVEEGAMLEGWDKQSIRKAYMDFFTNPNKATNTISRSFRVSTVDYDLYDMFGIQNSRDLAVLLKSNLFPNERISSIA